MVSQKFDLGSFVVRFAGAFGLVAATWNPSAYSYADWLAQSLPRPGPLVILAGIVLLIGWVIYLRATFRSLGTIGMVLAAAFFATLIWLVIDLGWVSTSSMSVVAWLVIFAVAAIMATGMSWSHIRRRLSGQVDVDDVDEG
jgi:hypothetical protein